MNDKLEPRQEEQDEQTEETADAALLAVSDEERPLEDAAMEAALAEPHAPDEDGVEDPEVGAAPDEAAAAEDASGVARVVGVKFRRAGKTYFFNAGHLNFNIGDQLIVETDRGLGLVRVVTPVVELDQSQLTQELKRVIRKANWNDLERSRKNKQREQEAQDFCSGKIRQRGMDMKLVKVEYLHDASKAIFYFTAEQRVDFRELVKDLARELHTRIEMRQIGVRDETKMIGGLGPCGREVCCSSFLSDFSPVSVRMAKDQNLAMNPSKVSGLCGRLMCCLAYEHKLYREKIKSMPKKGKLMTSHQGPCRIIDLNILAETALVELESGKTVFLPADQLFPPGKEPPAPEEDESTMDGIDSSLLESDDPSVLEKIGSREAPKPGRAYDDRRGPRPRGGADARRKPHPQKENRSEKDEVLAKSRPHEGERNKPAGKKEKRPRKHDRRGRDTRKTRGERGPGDSPEESNTANQGQKRHERPARPNGEESRPPGGDSRSAPPEAPGHGAAPDDNAPGRPYPHPPKKGRKRRRR